MKVILLFGEMGSGKSYLGKQLAQDTGFVFIEGDSFASGEMQAAIDNFKIITKEMVDDLVLQIGEAVKFWAGYPSTRGVVVSQALYLEEHRLALIESWQKAGYDVEVRWVRVPTVQHIKQLWSRPNGARWLAYWIASKPFFQKPKHQYITLHNRR